MRFEIYKGGIYHKKEGIKIIMEAAQRTILNLIGKNVRKSPELLLHSWS